MVLEITQDTFNSAVKENVEILGLTEEEAVEEAVKQFESQGVDLSKIIKESMSKAEFNEISESVRKLEELQNSKKASDALNETLTTLRLECEKGLQHKVEAGKIGAYNILLNICENNTDKSVEANTLRTLTALMTKQPDLLDDRGVAFIINSLKDKQLDYEIVRLLFRWTKECCVMHEKNRQLIYDAHILDILKEYLKEHVPTELIREALSVCRALVLDDDVRVEFGRAHEHARVIASETLCSLMDLLSKFRGEELLNFDILLTLTSLMVRTEFCKKVEDANGLELIKSVMHTYSHNEKIVRQCFKLLKSLAGNDECKVHIVQHGFVPVIIQSLTPTTYCATTVTAGLSCVAALTLRSPENSKALFDHGITQVIINIMKQHADQKEVQKTGSWAIRNMVSRSKYQCKTFLDLGAEEVLQKALKSFKNIEYDIKAALRDLGCKVKLKEEWTGKGGALTTGLTNLNVDD
ncbi:armadillo repeat-containing protein 6 homolog [Sitophilus oryzae]|uniref:Armadillo repeat-containing protein 6 homolog n=1 Tax=Sitophilus oryzae TaxID=7048 RepID=A0A6J2XB91_SITOR|nr:armadillo repeat-containing protein 6 homolog [Sitophilus oryzae]